MSVSFKMGKRIMKGDRKGKRYTENVVLDNAECIHDYLWDATNAYDHNRCDYIIEWYKRN